MEGLPASALPEPKQESSSQEQSSIEAKSSCVHILMKLSMSNSQHLSQKNLSYQELKQLIEKLDGDGSYLS